MVVLQEATPLPPKSHLAPGWRPFHGLHRDVNEFGFGAVSAGLSDLMVVLLQLFRSCYVPTV